MFSEFCFCSTGLITYGYDTSFIWWPDIILHALRSKGDVTCWIVFLEIYYSRIYLISYRKLGK